MAIELITKKQNLDLKAPTTADIKAAYNSGKAEGFNDGFVDGYAKGSGDGWSDGMIAAERALWDTLQNKGARKNYRYAFYNHFWINDIFNPAYPITCSEVSSEAFRYSGITDTKVDIIFTHTSSNYVFANCASLKTIKSLSVTEGVTFVGWFAGCSALENITISGVIGQNIDFSPCTLLSYASLKSIKDHLKDYGGGTAYTLTVGSANAAKYTDADKAEISKKGWVLK